MGGQLLDLVDARAAAQLQPSMLGLYVELGLHTNSDAVTDKNSQRYLLMKVLRRLWLSPANWAAFVAYAAAANDAADAADAADTADAGGGGAASAAAWFGEFATTLVKENLFLLDDALGRLADVKKREDEKADEASWNAQSDRLKRDREARLESVRRTAKSFLDLGKASLSALLLLTSESKVGAAFTHVPQRARKMAAMLVEFLRRLSGPDTKAIKVANREKLGWHPRRLLSDTMALLLQCVQLSKGFVDDLTASDNYDLSVLEHARKILADHCQAEFAPTKLDQLGALLTTLRAGTDAASSGDGQTVTERAVAAASHAAAAESAAELLKRVDAAYVEEMRPLAYESISMKNDAETAYEHYYKANITDCPAESIARAKMQRLMRELKKLAGGGGGGSGGDGALPISAEAAIYARIDEDRSDVLKVLISGPADLNDRSRETPYALGLFEFHVFIPPDYPSVPPLVNLQTTGDGMVRFNPNLYSDGKVCLSLLGTWHGEGWTVPTAGQPLSGSTILQVLVSIQSIIMVSKPYFNEPGYADEEGTPAGEERSREYNENIRLAAMRFAMRDTLKRPPRGFEDVVRRHFVLNRPLIERQCAAWLHECIKPQNRAAMEKAYTEILALIDQAEGKGDSSGAGEAEATAEGGQAGESAAPMPVPPPPSVAEEEAMAAAAPATAAAPMPPPSAPTLPTSPPAAASSPSQAAFTARVHELFASFVAAGQDRQEAAAKAMQQAQAEQAVGAAPTPGPSASNDVEMA